MLHSSTFWLAVSFAIFIAIVYKPAAALVVRALDSHSADVRRELEEAERLRGEAQELLSSSQRQHREALQEAEAIVAAAKAEAENLRVEAASRLKELLASREAAALAKIAQAEATAAHEARELATQLALAASRELLKQKLTGTSADALIDSAISELPQKLAS